MIACQEAVEKALEELRVGFRCARLGQRLEIVTPYLHPDNDLVEVFIEELASDRVKVTDLGETLRRLETLGMDVLASPKRTFVVQQIASRTHVTLSRGRLEKEGAIHQVGALILDVVAAAHAISDLIFSSKAYEPATLAQEAGELLQKSEIHVEYNVPVVGSTGKRYRVSLKALGARTGGEILIEAMSPAEERLMTPVVNRVFRMWSDVNTARNKVSLLNDDYFSWRQEDLSLLERVSVIRTWSTREALLQYVTAA